MFGLHFKSDTKLVVPLSVLYLYDAYMVVMHFKQTFWLSRADGEIICLEGGGYSRGSRGYSNLEPVAVMSIATI